VVDKVTLTGTYRLSPQRPGFDSKPVHVRFVVDKVTLTGTYRLSPQRPGFDSKPVHVRFVVDKVTLTGTDFSPSTWVFACISIILPFFHTHIKLNATLTIRTKEKSLGTLKYTKQDFFGYHGVVDRIVLPRYLVFKQLNTMECDAAGFEASAAV